MMTPSQLVPFTFRSRISTSSKALQLIRTQLELVGLDVDSIKAQDIKALEASLERIDELIAHPTRLTLLPIRHNQRLGYHFAQDGIVVSFDSVICPLLQHRKTLILGRLKALSLGDSIQALSEVIDETEDPNLADKLKGLKKQSQSLEGQLIESSQEQEHLRIQLERERLALFEGKFRLFLLLLEREMAASLIGALFIIVAPIVLMANGGDAPALKQCLFLVFGYFFGQAANRSFHT